MTSRMCFLRKYRQRCPNFWLSIPMPPFWSKSNFAHHFISARFQKKITSQTSGSSGAVPNLERQIFRTDSNSPKVGTSNLWNHRRRSHSLGHLDKNGHFGHSKNGKMAIFVPMYQTLGLAMMVPKFGMGKTFLKHCWYKIMSKITFWSERCHWNGKSEMDSLRPKSCEV